MRLTKEELIEKFKNYAGEDVTSDAAIELLEDISDSVEVEKEETEEGEGEGGEDWETKYKELDESWRKKYAERFSEPGGKEKEPEEEGEEETEEETEEERAENVTYEDLFEEKKKKED
jgi:hypothetical protein